MEWRKRDCPWSGINATDKIWLLGCSPIVQDTGVQSQVESYQRLKKLSLMPPCLTLSIIRYVSRVAPSLTPQWSNNWKGHLRVVLDYGWPTYIYIYIYIYVCIYYVSVFYCKNALKNQKERNCQLSINNIRTTDWIALLNRVRRIHLPYFKLSLVWCNWI